MFNYFSGVEGNKTQVSFLSFQNLINLDKFSNPLAKSKKKGKKKNDPIFLNLLFSYILNSISVYLSLFFYKKSPKRHKNGIFNIVFFNIFSRKYFQSDDFFQCLQSHISHIKFPNHFYNYDPKFFS